MTDDTLLKYPIGKLADQPFTGQEAYDEKLKIAHIREISFLPSQLEQSVQNLDAEQLHAPYRPGGWTVQQVVHHVPDSHLNAYTRFKLALTEDNPTIRPYDQDGWANLSDTAKVPINISLTLLHALHVRWVELMINMKPEEWQRTVVHPEHNKQLSLWNLLASYSWHGKHHVAHITSLRDRMGW